VEGGFASSRGREAKETFVVVVGIGKGPRLAQAPGPEGRERGEGSEEHSWDSMPKRC
jgi:hypothetical protein